MSKTLHIKADNSNVKLDVDLIYPVGSIYMSVNSTSPATLFGGTWEQIKDTFLLGSGSYTLGATGGEKEHTLTVDEMPSHEHEINRQKWLSTDSIAIDYEDAIFSWIRGNPTTTWKSYKGFVERTGGSRPHNNMPPYLVVNIWKRTA